MELNMLGELEENGASYFQADSTLTTSDDADAYSAPEEFKECLLCGKLSKSEQFHKLGNTDSKLTVMACTVLGVSQESFETMLPKLSFCYKCVQRLNEVQELESQKTALQIRIQEIKTAIHKDFKKLLTTGDGSSFPSKELEIRLAIFAESNELNSDRDTKLVNVDVSPVIKLAETCDTVEDHNDVKIDPLALFHDETTTAPADFEENSHSFTEKITFQKNPKRISKGNKRRVLKLGHDSFDLGTSKTTLFTKAALIKRRKKIRLKRKEQLKKSKTEMIHPETGEVVPKLKCPHGCLSVSFPDESRLQAHIRRKHEGMKYPEICETCGKSFRYMIQLKDHQLTHIGENSFSCSICSKTYKTKKSLRLHEEEHVTGKRHKCSICGKGFSQLHHLAGHYNMHDPKPRPRYACDYPDCTRSFARERDALNHKKTHEKPEDMKCQYCTKRFSSLNSLSAHVKTNHEGVPSFRQRRPCRIDNCDFLARNSKQWNKHRLEVHGIELPKVKCEQCFKMFSTQAVLDVHLKMHANDLQFECQYCDKPFAGKLQRDRHEKLHLITTKDYICEICGKGFATSSYLGHHRRYHLPKDHPNYRDMKKERQRKLERLMIKIEGKEVGDLVRVKEEITIDFTKDRSVPYFEEGQS